MEEHYFVEQEVSEHRSTHWARSPRGRIEWSIPYDGAALRRVGRAARRGRVAVTPGAQAVAGRLAFADHEETDLAAALALGHGSDAVALSLPLRAPSSPALEDVGAGQHENALRVVYRPAPDRPDIFPVTVRVDIEDPDTANVGNFTVRDAIDPRQLYDEVVSKMMDYATFRPGLRVSIGVTVTADVPRRRTIAAPVVRRVALELPHLTSSHPDSLALRLNRRGRREPFQHHAARRTVEWRDVPTELEDEHADERGNDVRRHRFHSTDMHLGLGQPGELFERAEIVVRVEVEMPDHLLSGTQARSFDATGRLLPAAEQVTTRTVLHSRCSVLLDDAFAHRQFAPYQSFVFDEIVPERGRIADIEAALGSLGFEITPPYDLKDYAPSDALLWFLEARRPEGPTTSVLKVVVRGRRGATRRRSQSGSEHQYSSRLESGDLTVFVRGWTQGDVAVLVRRMNEFHRALKDRFRPLRSRR